MKLKQAEITDFRSVRDSNRFEVGDITCLVGKNEAGKTSLLDALYRLNPVVSDDGKFDVIEDFPRSDVEDYRQAVETGEREPATVVTAVFQLEPADLTDLSAKFGDKAIPKPELTLTKG